MRAKEIAEKYGFNESELLMYISGTDVKRHGILSDKIDDEDVPEIVRGFRRKKNLEQFEDDEKARKEKERKQAIANMLVTSGFNFDGYTITKYSGYISGDDAIQIDRDKLFNNNGQMLTDSLVLIRTQALKELKEAAYDLGCNAIIGVDFDYMTFEPESIQKSYGNTTHVYQPYVVCVTANGNAVIIEKN